MHVRDQDEALAFSRDVLGLEVRVDAQFEWFRWLTVSPPSQPDIWIGLVPAGMDRRADQEALRTMLAKGSLNGVIFTTDEVDATFEKDPRCGCRGAAGADRPALRPPRLRFP